MEQLFGYTLGEMTNRNAGTCLWCFGTKNGKEYFIKQFLNPKYPYQDKVLSPERIEKIENGRTQIQPEDALLLAKYYRAPALLNHYCCEECPIGQVHAVRTESKELAQIAVETLNSLNKLSRSRDRLLEIVEDGEVQADEYADFAEIKSTLDRIALSVSNLQLWVDEQIAAGNLVKPKA